MKIVRIDGGKLQSMADLQDQFREEMEMPPYYGCNLDALFDVLTCVREETWIYVSGTAAAHRALGKVWGRFVAMCLDAVEENKHLNVVWKH